MHQAELENTQNPGKRIQLSRKIVNAETHYRDWKHLADKWKQEADRLQFQLDGLIEKYNSYKSRSHDRNKTPCVTPQ